MAKPVYLAVSDTYQPRKALRPVLSSPQDVATLCRYLERRKREHMLALLLDTANHLIASETVAIGSLNVARAMPRDVLAPAMRRNAASVIVVHNHPSGLPEPSPDDHVFTESLCKAADLLGLVILDHIIIAREGFVSLRARGRVPGHAR